MFVVPLRILLRRIVLELVQPSRPHGGIRGRIGGIVEYRHEDILFRIALSVHVGYSLLVHRKDFSRSRGSLRGRFRFQAPALHVPRMSAVGRLAM